jgi:type I restriction enzyme S subunit
LGGDIKTTEYGVVARHFDERKLKDLCVDKTGIQTGPFGSQLHKEDYVSNGTPIITVEHLAGNRISHENLPNVSDEDKARLAKYHLATGDLVFSRVGSVDRNALVGPEEDGWLFSGRCLRVRVDKSQIDPIYLSYFFSLEGFKEHIRSVAVGATMPSINTKILSDVSIYFPPLLEQKAIAQILGALDDKIELNRQMNATLEGMAQALFKSWFVDFDPVIDNALAAGNPIPDDLAARAEVRRQALANGTANREAAKPFSAAFQQTESMGWIPEGWEVSHLIENVRLTMGQSPSSDHYNTNGDGLPFHQGVTNYGERFPRHEQYSTGGNRYAEDGDVLFSVRAPVGRINIANCKLIIGRGLAALRHEKNYQGFLVYFLKHTFATEDSIGSGTIFNAVNKKEMERIPLIVPPDDTTRAFDDIANSLDEKIASNAEQAETLTKLRDTLLPKLISGELRIPEAEQLTEEALA